MRFSSLGALRGAFGFVSRLDDGQRTFVSILDIGSEISKLHSETLVGAIRVALKSERCGVFPFCVHLERLSLPDIILGPLERNA